MRDTWKAPSTVRSEHLTRDGRPKIVPDCTYPLTGMVVVDRIYTDVATIDIEDGALRVRWIVESLSFEALQAMTGAPLENAVPA